MEAFNLLGDLLFWLAVFFITIILTIIIINSLDKRVAFKNKENTMLHIGAIAAIIGMLSPAVILLIIGEKISVDLFGKIGTIGDFFGGTMVGLLSFASLLFVSAAVVMQKEELRLQREEVMKTRKEFEITNETMKKQAFDSTFFNLISLQKEILIEIKFDGEQGRAAITKLFNKLEKTIFNERQYELFDTISATTHSKTLGILNDIINIYYNDKNFSVEYLNKISDMIQIGNRIDEKEFNIEEEQIDSSDEEYRKFLIRFFRGRKNFLVENYGVPYLEEDYQWRVDIYEGFYSENENYIGHYFRNLYRIVKYIFESELSRENQKTYIGILRAQLSATELIMLYYNINYSNKGKKFKDLLEKNEMDFFQEHLNELNYHFKSEIC